ncbi:hypothetical protein DXC06_00240 [Ruminococcus sp. OM07-7]|nr:hypothetical protein DXC06_00240 [Ruminococcus sp. OM07-7]
MNKKSGYALRIVLGGYLTYLGIRILSEMIQQRPSNMTLMSVLAVVFILVGVAYAGNAICKTFEIDIKKQIAKMIAKRKAEQKRKAEEAAVAKEMSQVTESTMTEVSDNTMPTMLSEEDRKKLEDAVSKADFEEKTMQDSKAEAIEKTADSDSTENEAAEKTVSEEKVESVEKLATTTESEETPDEEIKAEGTPVEETPAQEEELTDTRVVDIFAELNEEPVSEDAENDFEEK